MCLSCALVVPMVWLRSFTELVLRLDDISCCYAQLRGNLDFLGTERRFLTNAWFMNADYLVDLRGAVFEY